MTPGLLTLLFMAGAAWLLAQPVRVRACWRQNSGSVRLRFLWMEVGGPSPHGKPRQAARSKRRSRRRASRGAPWQYRRAVPGVLRATWAGLRYLLRRVRLERLELVGRLATTDPALTGTLWGMGQSLRALLPDGPDAARIDVTPDFVESRSSVALDAELSARAGVLLLTPVVMAWRLPVRELWRAWRSPLPRPTSGVQR